MSKIVIDMNDIIKKYYIGQPNELQILHGMNLKIFEDEYVSKVGETGGGKSTLKNIMGL